MRTATAFLLGAFLASAIRGGEPLSLARALRLAGTASQAADASRLSLAGAREETAQIKGLYWREFSSRGAIGSWTIGRNC
jgi:hypothetical protein